MIYGYDSRTVNEHGLKEMSEVAFSATPEDLRRVAAFLLEAADELEAGPRSIQWHQHLPGPVRQSLGCDIIVAGPSPGDPPTLGAGA